MAMDAGNVSAGGGGTGLAKEMYDDYIGKLGSLGTPPGSIAAQQQVADLCNSVAQTFIAHITANAEITTVVMNRNFVINIAIAAPAVDKIIAFDEKARLDNLTVVVDTALET